MAGISVVFVFTSQKWQVLNHIPFSFIMFIQVVQILDELVEEGSAIMDCRNKDEVIKRMKAAVASKQFGQEDILCPLIAEVSLSRLTLL